MSQAAERALAVLQHVAGSPEPLSATDVTVDLGIDKSTSSRVLALLVEQGWLIRDPWTRLFSVGPTLAGLSAKAAISDQLRSLLLPLLSGLREETGETVSFHQRVGDRRVCVAGLEGPQVIRRALPVGDVFPLHHGPSGKSMLAFADPEQRARAFADADPGRLAGIRGEVELVARDGFLSVDGDPGPDVGAISAPVFDRGGVFGSITIAGPVQRWDEAARARCPRSLLAAARSLSTALGAGPGRYDGWISALPVPASAGPS